MKKIIIIVAYFIFTTILNICLLNINIDFMDYCNLIFLNTNSYQNYGLNIWNFKYIISFYVFIVILINLTFSYINENSSFLNMIMYRKGKKKTMFMTAKNNILKLLKYHVAINITIVALSVSMPFITMEKEIVSNWCVFNIYLIRTLLLFFFATMKNFFYSLNSDFVVSMAKTYIFMFILMLIDIIIGSNLICFSGSFLCEISYMIIYFIIVVIYCYLKVILGGKND